MTPNEVTKEVTGLPDPNTPVIFNVQETGMNTSFVKKTIKYI